MRFFVISACVGIKQSEVENILDNNSLYNDYIQSFANYNNKKTTALIEDIKLNGFSFIELQGTYTYCQGTDFKFTSNETSYFVPLTGYNKRNLIFIFS